MLFFILTAFLTALSAKTYTDTDISLQPTIHQSDILILAKEGKLKKAIAATENQLKLNPDDPAFHLLYARLLFWNDQPKKAPRKPR